MFQQDILKKCNTAWFSGHISGWENRVLCCIYQSNDHREMWPFEELNTAPTQLEQQCGPWVRALNSVCDMFAADQSNSAPSNHRWIIAETIVDSWSKRFELLWTWWGEKKKVYDPLRPGIILELSYWNIANTVYKLTAWHRYCEQIFEKGKQTFRTEISASGGPWNNLF